jgi:hypothetical protein
MEAQAAAPHGQQRITPTQAQIGRAHQLLDAVPHAAYHWETVQGRRFLSYVDELAAKGVPTSWLAQRLGLDASRLYAALSRRGGKR